MKILLTLQDTPFLGEDQRYHYLYKIINKLNGKYYYGMHSTDDLNDGYRGSGRAIKVAIKKYGVENFEKIVFEFFANRKQLAQAEKRLINEDVLQDRQCYNMMLGGIGSSVCIPSDNRRKIVELETGIVLESVQALRELTKRSNIDSTELDHFVSRDGKHYARFNQQLADNPQQRQLLIEQIEQNIQQRYQSACKARSIGHSQPWIDLKTMKVYPSWNDLRIALSLPYIESVTNVRGRRFNNGVVKLSGNYFVVYDENKPLSHYHNLIQQIYDYENRERVHYQSKRVQCVETGEIFKTCRDASKSMGLALRAVTCVINGYQQTAGGYHWKLVDYNQQIQQQPLE